MSAQRVRKVERGNIELARLGEIVPAWRISKWPSGLPYLPREFALVGVLGRCRDCYAWGQFDMPFAGRKLGKQPLALQHVFNVFPIAPCKAVNVHAVRLAGVIPHLQRGRLVGMDGAAAEAITLPPPLATECRG
jgi:hypothetical protein